MSVLKSLQTEITRVARKEIKKELEAVKRVNATQRGLIANLRRDVTELQREVNRLKKASGAEVVMKEETTSAFWISGKGVFALRKRLGLTQAELAKLAGVTIQSIVKWEKHEGKIPFRKKETPAVMQQIRSMGKKEAWKKLGK